MQHDIPELDAAGLRRFSWSTGGIIIVLFGVVLPFLLGRASFPKWPWVLGLTLGLWGFAAPLSLNGVYRLWMRFGLMMSRVMNPLVLSGVYFLVFLPLGALMRLFGWDPMARKLEAGSDTYRVPSRPQSPKSMERPF